MLLGLRCAKHSMIFRWPFSAWTTGPREKVRRLHSEELQGSASGFTQKERLCLCLTTGYPKSSAFPVFNKPKYIQMIPNVIWLLVYPIIYTLHPHYFSMLTYSPMVRQSAMGFIAEPYPTVDAFAAGIHVEHNVRAPNG